jgi:hypothetical protein
MILKRQNTTACSLLFSSLIVIPGLAACPRACGEGIFSKLADISQKSPLQFAVANSGNDRNFTPSLRLFCDLGVNGKPKPSNELSNLKVLTIKTIGYKCTKTLSLGRRCLSKERADEGGQAFDKRSTVNPHPCPLPQGEGEAETK